MKYSITLALLLVYSAGYSQIIINGKINNYDGKSKVYYSRTIEGILAAFDNVSEELQPTPNGSFRIKYENKGLAAHESVSVVLPILLFTMKTLKLGLPSTRPESHSPKTGKREG